MLRPIGSVLFGIWALLFGPFASAMVFGTAVPMRNKGAATYYVKGQIAGVGEIDLLVDTGSGYSTIGEDTLNVLVRHKRAVYVKKLTGIMANGSQMTVPVYRIGGVVIGAECWLNDVEAAVFPGSTRFILGLSALRQAAPFIFSLDPPELVLSNCGIAPSVSPGPSQPADESPMSTSADVAMAEAEEEPLLPKE
jgi:hypothetical protein